MTNKANASLIVCVSKNNNMCQSVGVPGCVRRRAQEPLLKFALSGCNQSEEGGTEEAEAWRWNSHHSHVSRQRSHLMSLVAV